MELTVSSKVYLIIPKMMQEMIPERTGEINHEITAMKKRQKGE